MYVLVLRGGSGRGATQNCRDRDMYMYAHARSVPGLALRKTYI